MNLKRNVLYSLLTGSLMTLSVGCEQPSSESKLSKGGNATVSFNMQGTQPGDLASAAATRASSSIRVAQSSGPTSTIQVRDRNGSNVGTLDISYAKVVVEEVEIKLDQNDINTEVDFPGPFVIDLLSDTITPEPTSIVLAAGSYSEIWLGFNQLTSEGATNIGIAGGDPLVGYTFIVEGTYTGPSASGAQTSIPFRIALNTDRGLDLSGGNADRNTMNILSNRINDVIVAFRMNKWMDFSASENWANIDMANAQLSSGEIILNNSSTGNNAEIFDYLIRNMLESADYGIDEDGDGELESDEDDDPSSEDGADDQ
jgi:hypothetical protein